MQEIHAIAQEGCSDLRFKPLGKLPEVLSLPHKSDSWPVVRVLVGTLAKGDVTNAENALNLMSKIVCVVNKVQSAELRGVTSFLHYLRKRAKHPLKYEEAEQYIHALTDADFVKEVIPFIACLALEIEELFPEGTIRMLRAGEPLSVSIEKRQAACLLANMFLCTIPDRAPQRHFPELCSFFYMNSCEHDIDSHITQKMLCMVNYFLRVRKGAFNKVHPIVFERKVLSEEEIASKGSVEGWLADDSPLEPVAYFPEGKI